MQSEIQNAVESVCCVEEEEEALPGSCIESRHVRYVVAAAGHGSFRRAAAALGVQESAVSRRIRDLEDRMGITFFIRSPGGVKITHAGKQFVQVGRNALSKIGMAKVEVCGCWQISR